MADKKISELDQVLQINNDAVFPMSQNSGGTATTYKTTITQIGAEVGEDQTFSNLQTSSKNLVGAINEIAQGGGGGSSNANIAPDYDATSTYAVGDWCIYNGTLYQCNTAIPVAEAFDPTHWTAKKVVDAFADIEDELDNKVDTSDFDATNLPIQSGSATNTKDYIDSKVANTTGTCTVNATNCNSGSVVYAKSGNVVTVGGYIYTKGTWSNTAKAIFELPFKPAIDLNPPAQTVIGGDNYKITYLNVSSSFFNVRLDNSVENNQLLRFGFSYVAVT